MIIYLDRDKVPELEKYDLCIVGAGAAGITIAKEFAASSKRVALVESGDFELHEDTQELYKGEAEGNITKNDDYLYASRLRYFGGSTNHWGGWCRPLDKIDFEKRDWVPNSGWPITKQLLEPYYRRAEKLVEINSFEQLDKEQYKWGKSEEESHGIRAPFFQLSPPTRFGIKYREDITEAENIDLFLNANLTNIKLTENRQRVDHLKIESLNNNKAEIESSFTVLACGAIENPRILLNCRDDIPKGIGNQNELVGKYFMEHSHYSSSGVLLSWDLIEFGRFGKWAEFRLNNNDAVPLTRVFSITEGMQKRKKLLNVNIGIKKTFDLDYVKKGNNQDQYAAGLAQLSESLLVNDSVFKKPQLYTLSFAGEQAPNESNSVSLVNEKDEIGLLKILLKCSVSDWELDKYLKSLKALSRGLGLEREGRLRIDLNKGSIGSGLSHHMGTTRMSDNPQNGVVDADCKVHGIDSLYIAGSSVFPTVGHANPTFTIIALAIRLADHLKKQSGS